MLRVIPKRGLPERRPSDVQLPNGFPPAHRRQRPHEPATRRVIPIRRTGRGAGLCRRRDAGHPHSGRDVFVRLALAAQRTTRVTLFPSVTNPVSRGPRMLATHGATLGELAPGRARLVISSGKAAVEYVEGMRATVSQVARAVETVRETLAARFASVPPVPVYVNASSPRMLSAAGSAADGVYAMVGVDPDVVATAMGHVAAGPATPGGTRTASRSRSGFRCSWPSPRSGHTRAPASTLLAIC